MTTASVASERWLAGAQPRCRLTECSLYAVLFTQTLLLHVCVDELAYRLHSLLWRVYRVVVLLVD